MTDDELPTCEQFQSGIRAYEDNETRGWVYYEALAEVTVGWGQPNAMAAGVKRLLDAWHQAFYRFGAFDPVELEEAIAMRMASLESYRLRSISSLAEVDREGIGQLFEAFLDALRGGKRRSPVAVAKTLHLLAPEFFPPLGY